MSKVRQKTKTSKASDWWLSLFGILVAVLAFWLPGMAIWQHGWSGLGALTVWYLCYVVRPALTLAFLYKAWKAGPVYFLAAMALAGIFAWIVYSGTRHSWQRTGLDLLCAVVALGLTWGVFELLGRWRRRHWPQAPELGRAWRDLDVAVWALLAWIFVSLVSSWWSRPMPVDPARFATLGPQRSIMPERAERWQDLRIGLALSGGGYRAATLHAGVLQALEDLGIRVSNLSTVSGGSIIGSYYAGGGAPEDFVQALRDRRLDLKHRLMLFHNATRLTTPMKVPGLEVELFPWYRFDRLDVQEALLADVLLADVDTQALLAPEQAAQLAPGQPHLMIAVTDMKYGFQVGMLSDGLLILGSQGSRVYRGPIYDPDETWSLSRRVATSGAFPLAFPPRPFRLSVSPATTTYHGPRDLLLVDGGVRDNLGLDLLNAANSSAQAGANREDPAAGEASGEFMPKTWDLDAVLVSDGGAVIGVLEEPGFLSMLPRAFDVANIQIPGKISRDACQYLWQRPPRFSPSQMLLPPDMQFNRRPETKPQEGPSREWSVSFDPVRYPAAVLERILVLLPEPSPKAPEVDALSLARSFRQTWERHGIRDHRWSRSLRQGLERCADTNDLKKDLLAGTCEAVALRTLVRHELMRHLDIFRATSTLDDHLDSEKIDALGRLGQVLVYLQWNQLSRSLDEAARCRERPPEVPQSSIFESGARRTGIVPK